MNGLRLHNVKRVFSFFKAGEHACVSALASYSDKDILSFTPRLLNEADVTRSRSANKMLGGTSALMQVIPKVGKKSILGINWPILRFFKKEEGLIFSKKDILNMQQHEFFHMFLLKVLNQHSIDFSKIVNIFEDLSKIRNYAGQIFEGICQKSITLQKTAKNMDKNTEKYFDLATKIYFQALKKSKKEVLIFLRQCSSDTLQNFKLVGLAEFQAMDKSLRYWPHGLSREYLMEITRYRRFHEELNNWIRKVEYERLPIKAGITRYKSKPKTPTLRRQSPLQARW